MSLSTGRGGLASSGVLPSCRVRTLEDVRPFAIAPIEDLPSDIDPWPLPVYGTNSTLRINKASLRLRTNSWFDGTMKWEQVDAAFVPIWKSGSTTFEAQMARRAGFQHSAHSFAGRVGTAAITKGTVALAVVRNPIDRFESAFRTMNELNLASADISEHRQRLAKFVEAVWRGDAQPWGEHLLTQMYFLTSTDRHGQPLAFTHVGKLESPGELEATMDAFEGALGLAHGTFERTANNCTNGCHIAKHGLLRDAPELLRRVCALYQQDFVCLGYHMPRACLDAPLPVPPVPRTQLHRPQSSVRPF